MGYQLYWFDDEETIICQKYIGKVSTDDYYLMIKESAELLSAVSYPVDVIVDATEGSGEFKDLLAMSKYADRMKPPNQRLIIVVGVNVFIKALVKVARPFAPKSTENLIFVDTIEDAEDALYQYREKLKKV